MSDWLNSFTNTRRLRQFQATKRFAERGRHTMDVINNTPVLLPIEHTKYILTNGKKAYRKWVEDGCPSRRLSHLSAIAPAKTQSPYIGRQA